MNDDMSSEVKRCSSPLNCFQIPAKVEIGIAPLAPVRKISIAYPRNIAEAAFEQGGLDSFAETLSERVFSFEFARTYECPSINDSE
jgi:hypothetical protein